MKTPALLPADERNARLRTALYAGFLAILLVLGGCQRTEDAASLPADHRFPIPLEDRTVHVELAVTREEQSRGLMHRQELEEDAGMLFVSRYPRRMSFFMKNTPIPLDIGYFSSAGVLREVYAMHPFDESTVASQSNQIQFALEMNQGWFSANGIGRGARLDLDAVAEALRERGFDPKIYGLPDG